MALRRKKKKQEEERKEPLQQPLVTGKKVFEVFDQDSKSHDEWERKTMPTLAYEYYATNQLPRRHAEDATVGTVNSYWVQINRIREAHKTRMGVLTNSPPKWQVWGRGKDSADRQRIKLQRYLMTWMGKESGLEEEILAVLNNFSLVGMGWLRLRWDKTFLTKMDTIGMTVPDSLDPRFCSPDNRARKASVLDGSRCSYTNRVTKEQFRYEWGERLRPDGSGKKINVDKIFKDIEDKRHPDSKLNQGKNESEKVLTIVEYEYYRIINKKGTVGNEEIVMPVPEYRVALAAGFEKLTDYVSPINDLRIWQKILFSNDPMADMPYSSSDFQAEKELQDLMNIMASMTIDNQARQMNSPWLSLEGTQVDPDYWKLNGGKAGANLVWKFTQEMLASGISLEAARPRRVPPGQVGGDWLAMQNYVAQMFDKISVEPVARGENPQGVTSGKQAQILTANALQPSVFVKKKLEAPLARVGQVYYQHSKTYITEEMELPVDDEGIGVDKGIQINRTLDSRERLALSELIAIRGEKVLELPAIKMVSVRKGDDRIALIDWLKDGNKVADNKDQLVENDTTFGNFNVSITMDPAAEVSRLEKRERFESLSALLISMGAPETGLKLVMDATEVPERDKIMEDTKAELASRSQAQPEEVQGAGEQV